MAWHPSSGAVDQSSTVSPTCHSPSRRKVTWEVYGDDGHSGRRFMADSSLLYAMHMPCTAVSV
jgi:hypothetical protein